MVKRPVPHTSCEPFELHGQLLGAMPVINHFWDRLGVGELLETHVPAGDPRLRVAPATALGVVVRNLLVSHEPVYGLSEWARPYEPAALGLQAGDAELLNDDRVGRCLGWLFDADRASLLTDMVLRAVRRFGIDCSQLHNDSTTITFTGARRAARTTIRGGKPTAAAKRGHNKDYRPDLRQLLWILTVTADGAVPIAYRLADGNTEDSTTHIATWDQLVAMVGRADFLYVADCKLATRDVMDHIAAHHGRFVTVLPRSRREDTWFRDWITRNTPDWAVVSSHPSRRQGEPDDVLSSFESPLGSSEGYRIIWIRSTAKLASDAISRAARIERAETGLADLARRLAGPKCRITTRVAAQDAATAIVDELDVARYFETFINQHLDKDYRAEHRGNPGPDTRFRQQTRLRFTLTWRVRHHAIKAAAASDGCWPLITCDPDLSPADVLAAYKYQPNLERRNHILKGPQAVAPVYLHNPARIEGLMFCHFIALLVGALIERQIRTAMANTQTKTIPLYPEDRDCAAPSAERILEIFAHLERHHLTRGGKIVQTFDPTLNPLQRHVLKLLGVPVAAYRTS